jgi:predicted HAD superfamily Cof-like phosphohydrolase
MFNRVAEFHKAFGHPIGTSPNLPDQSIRDLRISLIDEELEEYCAAFASNDRIEMADALADLLFVLAGAAVVYGVAPHEPIISPYDGLAPLANLSSTFDLSLRDEYAVYLRAEHDNDLEAIAVAICHMMTEIFGIARQSAIPINAVFAEVCRSNLSKLDEHGKPILRADGKVLKSNLYSPPDIAAVLAKAAHA